MRREEPGNSLGEAGAKKNNKENVKNVFTTTVHVYTCIDVVRTYYDIVYVYTYVTKNCVYVLMQRRM